MIVAKRSAASAVTLAVLQLPSWAADAAEFKVLDWQVIEDTCPRGIAAGAQCTLTQRLMVPGGWLVRSTHTLVAATAAGSVGGLGAGTGLAFVPDANHSWQPK
jgi:hypothetical protein